MKMTMEISEIVFAINLSCKQAFEMLFIDVNDKIRYGTWIETSKTQDKYLCWYAVNAFK